MLLKKLARTNGMVTTSSLLLFNADETSFQSGGGLTELVSVKYLPLDQEMKEGPLKVSAQKGASLVACFIKLRLFCNAFFLTVYLEQSINTSLQLSSKASTFDSDIFI